MQERLISMILWRYSLPSFVSFEPETADNEHEWMRDLVIMRLRRELIEQRCRGRASDEALETAVRAVSHHVHQMEQELTDPAWSNCPRPIMGRAGGTMSDDLASSFPEHDHLRTETDEPQCAEERMAELAKQLVK